MVPSRCAAAAALALIAGAAHAGEFQPSDYAYRAPLFVDGRSALYAAPLPAEVYRVATRADLGDLAVINGLDEVVPFAVRRPQLQPEPPAETASLPLFPLTGPGNMPGEALKLRLRSGTTSVEVDQPATPGAPHAPAAYLLDLRALTEPLTRLHLTWPADAPDFSARLSHEVGARLERQPGREVRRIGGPAVRAQFLRITWL